MMDFGNKSIALLRRKYKNAIFFNLAAKYVLGKYVKYTHTHIYTRVYAHAHIDKDMYTYI